MFLWEKIYQSLINKKTNQSTNHGRPKNNLKID